jgi:hypothetical protein
VFHVRPLMDSEKRAWVGRVRRPPRSPSPPSRESRQPR